MEKIPFEEFWDTLSETNTTLGFFVDFDKVSRNVDSVAICLNQLNYLLGKENLREAVFRLFAENPTAFDISVFGILVAVRDAEKKKVLDAEGTLRNLSEFFASADEVWKFIEGTGLAEVFSDKKISNLVDYVFGVEVGLDTNARKSRSGGLMATEISRRFEASGIDFRSEVESTEFPEITSLGNDKKRFDFVVRTREKTYLIEVNFYNSNGSKPNEVARAYMELAQKIGVYPNFEFVWVTDGHGWKSSKNKIQEAYAGIPNLFNLTTFEKFLDRVIREGQA